jgi:hypothetical protein
MKFKEAYENYSIRGVLGAVDNKRVLVCPLPQHSHSENTPSFSIHFGVGREWFHCFGTCGLSGDVIDLVGYMRIQDYDRSYPMRKKAVELLSEFEYSPPMPEEKKTELAPWTWKNFTPPGEDARAYAKLRGLSIETMYRFRIGQVYDWMTIPSFQDGELMGIKMRTLDKDSTIRYLSMKGSKRSLFNYDGVNMCKEPVFIVKGEIAAMFLEERGFKACAPTAGEGSYSGSSILAVAESRHRILVGDNDPDPEIRTKIVELTKKRAAAFDAELHFPPEQYKDIDSWLLDRPQDISILKEWTK